MKTAPTSDEILFSLLYSRTGPRRALSLKLSDTRVYEPEKQEISEESVSSPNPMSCSDTHTPKPSRQHPHPPTPTHTLSLSRTQTSGGCVGGPAPCPGKSHPLSTIKSRPTSSKVNFELLSAVLVSRHTGVPRSRETATTYDPTVGLCPGPYDDPRWGVRPLMSEVPLYAVGAPAPCPVKFRIRQSHTMEHEPTIKSQLASRNEL